MSEENPSVDLAAETPTSPSAEIPTTVSSPENSTGEPPKPTSKQNGGLTFALVAIIVVSALFFFGGGKKTSWGEVDFDKNPLATEGPKNQLATFLSRAQENVFTDAYPDIQTPYVAKIPTYTINPNELNNLAVFQDEESRSPQADFAPDNLSRLTQVHSFTVPETQVFFNQGSENLDVGSDRRTDDWTGLYTAYAGNTDECYRRLDGSLFISTDYVMHMYHRLIERQMEYMDQEEFLPRLKEMTGWILHNALVAQSDSDEENSESWNRVIAYMAVGRSLLNDGMEDARDEEAAGHGIDMAGIDQKSDTLENSLLILDGLGLGEHAEEMAWEELEKIYAADGIAPSTIFGGLSVDKDTFDYTQFKPRSYYNKNAALRSYFRAMMWFGRVGFNLNSDELTRDAINLTKIMDDENIVRKWQEIYEPTAFLVGVSDDLSFHDYMPVIQEDLASRGNKSGIGSWHTSDESIARVRAAAEDFAGPQIMSAIVVEAGMSEKTDEELLLESMGWRLMGQRVTPDGVIFEGLIQGDTKPDEKTGESLPSGATAMMVTAVLGSEKANTYLQSWATENYPDSKKVLQNKTAELRSEFATFEKKEWTQNAYWSWMYLYKSMINEDRNWTGYPRFMAFENWRAKDLNAIIGSWTELKHDTLLYAKQQYAERGAGGDDCETQPVPKGYIETNIEFFDRMESMAVMIGKGLEAKGLLHPEIGLRNESFIESVQFFRSLAVKQLANEVISDEEFEQLHRSTSKMSNLAEVLPGQVQTEREARSALIADVQTDGVRNEVTYEATGIPQVIYVAVKDANGARLTKGLVFSHYEFTRPLSGERLTDEEWWKYVYDKETKDVMPALSPWSRDI